MLKNQKLSLISKKILLLLTLASTSFVSANQSEPESASFNYIDVDTLLPLPYPGLTLGHREKVGNMAFDASIGMHSIVFASDVALTLKGMTYFADKQTYFGLGGSLYLATIYDTFFGAFSPLLCFGKEYEKNFYEANFSCIRYIDDELDFTPTIFFKYGIKF